MNSGIYHIKNLSTGMTYFGRTVDWSARKRRHLSDLRSGIHKNPRLQNSWKNRNESEFEFKLVWEETVDKLDELESFILDFCFDTGRLYNAHKNSVGGFLGQKHSEETKRKWSQLRRGTKMSDVAKQRQKESRKNSVAWAEHIEKTKKRLKNISALALTPESRKKALATRYSNGHFPKWDEARKDQIEKARKNLFAALDWAVQNKKTRGEAIKKFNSSWGSLKKFQPEWESINGILNIPKRASKSNRKQIA